MHGSVRPSVTFPNENVGAMPPMPACALKRSRRVVWGFVAQVDWNSQEKTPPPPPPPLTTKAALNTNFYYCQNYNQNAETDNGEVTDSAFSAFKLDKDGMMLWKEQVTFSDEEFFISSAPRNQVRP